uniref:RING-type domain-containing protein n=1 Tax=Capitella teleta TaxID=283909 RepID=X2B9Q0_CAPTE
MKASLPLLGVGFMTLFLSLCFCCYMWRLKKQGQKEMGYKEVRLIIHRNYSTNDSFQTCPVCLDDFSPKDKLAVCECTHIFHTKCLILWLNQSPTCPLC